MTRLLIFLLAAFVSTPAFAVDYYVSPSGTTAWPECTTQGSPCLAGNSTAGRAFLAAQAGDTVHFLDGVYSGLQDTNEDYRVPAFQPQNSGTSTAPITFKSLNKHGARLVGLRDSVLCGVIGAYNRDYIIWDGFEVSAVNSTGSAILAGAKFYDTDSCKFRNIDITGAAHSTGGAVNYEGLRVEGSANFAAENCTIRDYVETSGNHNTSAIKTYTSENMTFKNLEVYNSTCGIYIKHGDQNNATIENCFISGINGSAVFLDGSIQHITNVTMRNNVVVDCANAFDADSDGVDSAALDGLNVVNNSMYNVTSGVSWVSKYSAGNGPVVYNNIISASSKHIVSKYQLTLEGPKEIDHNAYAQEFSGTMRLYGTNATSYTSLAAWQASGELYGGGNPGVGSITGGPLFVNASGTMSAIADFALASGSPCIGAGRDGANIGADVTLVGVLAESDDDPDDPTPTTSGPLLRTGAGLLRVGDGVLRVQ